MNIACRFGWGLLKGRTNKVYFEKGKMESVRMRTECTGEISLQETKVISLPKKFSASENLIIAQRTARFPGFSRIVRDDLFRV